MTDEPDKIELKDRPASLFQALADISYGDMTDEQKRIVDAGRTIEAGFPSGLSCDELVAWVRDRFGL